MGGAGGAATNGAIVGAERRDVDIGKAYRVWGAREDALRSRTRRARESILGSRANRAPQISKCIPSMPTIIPAASTAARSGDDSTSIGFVLLMCV